MTTTVTDVTMPRLSDQMEEGTIVSWLVEDGHEVVAGDEIVEIETDKATATHEAAASGPLYVVAQVGETVPVGDVIARIGGDPGLSDNGSAGGLDEPAVDGGDQDGGESRAGTRSARTATPLARRVAAVHGVTLDGVRGTGPGGRVVKADVLRRAGLDPQPAPEDEAVGAPGLPADGSLELQRPTRLQQVVAKRMVQVSNTVPHFQVQTEVTMDSALAFRADLKAAAAESPAPSVNDIVVKACALALLEHPLVNGFYRPDGFELHDRVHVGIAVASDEGLVVATIPDTDTKSLGRIARDSRAVAERVRSGAATPSDLGGATFTVSNLGMFGMTAITPLINPPHAAILGVGAARAVLARSGTGDIVDQQLLTLTLSCDHRILNGADGSRFLFDVKAILEQPLRLAL